MGILGGGYYFHNIALPVVAKNPNPKTNIRSLFFGYCLVFCTYVLFGTVGYLGFSGETYIKHLKDGLIQENALNMFSVNSVLANIVRFCVFLQVVTVNAMLFACERA